MFTASFVDDTTIRDTLFSGVYAHANGSLDCFPLLYNSDNNGVPGQAAGR